MIRVGERSNRLDIVLLKIADQLETRTQRQLGILAKLIEPALMVVMAIMTSFDVGVAHAGVYVIGRFN